MIFTFYYTFYYTRVRPQCDYCILGRIVTCCDTRHSSLSSHELESQSRVTNSSQSSHANVTHQSLTRVTYIHIYIYSNVLWVYIATCCATSPSSHSSHNNSSRSHSSHSSCSLESQSRVTFAWLYWLEFVTLDRLSHSSRSLEKLESVESRKRSQELESVESRTRVSRVT